MVSVPLVPQIPIGLNYLMSMYALEIYPFLTYHSSGKLLIYR